MQLFGTIGAGLMVAACVFTFSSVLMGIAAILHLLPRLAPVAGRLLWGVLIGSCRLYYLLLSRLAEPLARHWGIDPLSGLARIVCTVSLSLIVGTGLMLLVGWPISIWSVIICVLHGLFVDFMWEELPDSGQIYMGTRTK